MSQSHPQNGHGRFISLEGTEGVGKSTNLAHVRSLLEDAGIPVLQTREPGGTPLAEEIRELLLANRDEAVTAKTELLLMFAARCQHVETVIKPALDAGIWVLSDRFVDASYAYQSGGRGLSVTQLEQLEQWCLESFKPDLTLLLDLPVEQGIARIQSRDQLDRFEHEATEFFQQVRSAYLERAKADPARIKVIDASVEIDAVKQQLNTVLAEFLQDFSSHD